MKGYDSDRISIGCDRSRQQVTGVVPYADTVAAYADTVAVDDRISIGCDRTTCSTKCVVTRYQIGTERRKISFSILAFSCDLIEFL